MSLHSELELLDRALANTAWTTAMKDLDMAIANKSDNLVERIRRRSASYTGLVPPPPPIRQTAKNKESK